MTSQTYQDLLVALAKDDPDLVVMTAENRAMIRGLPELLGERFIDMGISEQTMIGTAAGLALRGRKPIVHALACFLVMRAYEFIRTDIGIGQLPVTLVGYVPGFLSVANGPTHQAIEDVALMRGIPGMQIFCPADREELLAGLPQVINSSKPCYVRYHDGDPTYHHRVPCELGRAEAIGEGDVALLTYGALTNEVYAAQTLLRSRGIETQLINLRTLAPVDKQAIINAARSKRLLVTIEDHFLVGGLYTIVAELLLSQRLTAIVTPLALEQRWFKPLLYQDLLKHEGFSADAIADRVERAYREASA